MVFAFVSAHPAPCAGVAAPVVGEDSACGGGEFFYVSEVFVLLYFGVGGYLVYGLAVNKPSNGVGLPTEAVGMEFFGSIKAQVIHIFVAAFAVNEEVELHLGGIFAKEFDVDFVMGIFHGQALAVFVQHIITVFIQNELGVVRAGAYKEGAGSTVIGGGLHRNLIVAVVIVVGGTGFTCGVVKFYFLVI